MKKENKREGKEMKIGIIGLGNISQKAYLPVMMAMDKDIEWHLFTRDQEKLAKLGKKYRISNLYPSIDELLSSGIEAVFIHTATHTHEALIRECIEKGIHVYVDKPISENLEEVKALMGLAKEKKTLLITGFNRRFAPMIQKVKEVSNKNMILVQKTKPNSLGSVKYAIYDLFIHVVDTALFLLDEPVTQTHFSIKEENGELKTCVLHLTTEHSECIATMNYVSGANFESVEVQSPTGTHRVVNLTDYEIETAEYKQIVPFGDWDQTLEKRGFAPLIRATIAGIENQVNPVSMESSLESHRICQLIVEGYE
ncbi:MAG: Gfo/Idh/MocA family oxidoreductase [Carnobacterium sp.]|uniref:Gfo/Idh/MocA family protein n=1 Tax=Carnobacterium sp. TaxID=48221 RepID=UPI003314E55D